MKTPTELLAELERTRARCPAQVAPMQWAESDEWHYDGERICHKTNRFFSIVGLEHFEDIEESFVRHRQPIIDQPEVGTLAFLLRRRGSGLQMLVQIKAEPGNAGGAQLAPTCQATPSNLERAHGGDSPPGAELFQYASAEGQILADSLQSEHGTRFFRKRNRNVSLMWAGSGDDAQRSEHLTWVDTRSLLCLLDHDFVVNTDARSVLVTTPWHHLVATEPFCEPSDPFAHLLRDSYQRQCPDSAGERAERVRSWLLHRQQRTGTASEVIPLTDLTDYRLDARGLSGTGAATAFDVQHFRVSIPGRERGRWDQPLITTQTKGLVRLCVYRCNGELRFIFRAAYEAGLFDGIELHPTVIRGPLHHRRARMFADAGGQVVVQGWQSEEGGRFYRDISLYQVFLLEHPGEHLPEDFVSLSLREIEWLAPLGVFTNEARCALSMLLKYC